VFKPEAAFNRKQAGHVPAFYCPARGNPAFSPPFSFVVASILHPCYKSAHNRHY
jgi:hypothetical protein